MKDYTPADDVAVKGKGGKKKKKSKDPNAPKGAVSAYMYFVSEMRPQVKEENPEMSFGELGKAVGKKWQVISSEEKAKFEAMAKKDKERFERETAQYEAKKKTKGGDDSDGVDDDDDDDDESDDE
jgi:structure-specific recognition protein 1